MHYAKFFIRILFVRITRRTCDSSVFCSLPKFLPFESWSGDDERATLTLFLSHLSLSFYWYDLVGSLTVGTFYSFNVFYPPLTHNVKKRAFCDTVLTPERDENSHFDQNMALYPASSPKVEFVLHLYN